MNEPQRHLHNASQGSSKPHITLLTAIHLYFPTPAQTTHTQTHTLVFTTHSKHG